MIVDLVYLKQGLFTAFIPQSKAGEDAWRELSSQTGGTGKFYNVQVPAIKASLKAAGYIVRASKKPRKKEIDRLVTELERGEP